MRLHVTNLFDKQRTNRKLLELPDAKCEWSLTWKLVCSFFVKRKGYTCGYSMIKPLFFDFIKEGEPQKYTFGIHV